jgi:1-deoxy-D-xylulose-5-phosphate synthase
MMKTALDYNDGPIAIRYPRINGVGVEMDRTLQPIPIGTWETVREGDSAVVLALGPMIAVAEEAADLLKREGLSLRVVNARFIKPLDQDMLQKLAEENIPILVLEEGSQQGGVGSSVLEYYSSNGFFGARVRIMGIPDEFIEHGSIKEQLKEVGLTGERVASEVIEMLPRRRQRATGQ